MNKRLKDALLKISAILLGIIGGVTLALILEWRFRKRMEREGYVLEQYWRKK